MLGEGSASALVLHFQETLGQFEDKEATALHMVAVETEAQREVGARGLQMQGD